MHAVALPAKERVLADPCADDQIAARSSERAGIPFPGDANLRSGVDAGGHADDDRFDDAADTATEARRASRPVVGAARATLRTGREPLHVQRTLVPRTTPAKESSTTAWTSSPRRPSASASSTPAACPNRSYIWRAFGSPSTLNASAISSKKAHEPARPRS